MSSERVTKVLLLHDAKALVLTIGEHRMRPELSGTLDLPGGIVEDGEDEREGAVREILEETNIVVDPMDLRLVYATTATVNDKSVTKLFYAAVLDTEPVITLSWEHGSYEWIAVERLKELPFRTFAKESVSYYAEVSLASA